MAAHTGRVITYDQILNGDHEFAPMSTSWSSTVPRRFKPTADGSYPVPLPGIVTDREYGPA